MKYISILLCLVFAVSASAQKAAPYSYSAQKELVPKELGKVYLGMPLKEFADVIPLGKASADGRFDYLKLDIPRDTKTISGITVSVSGISRREMQEMLFEESSSDSSGDGFESDSDEQKIDLSKIPATAFVYSISISFKPEYDLKSYVLKTYGKNGEVRKPDDEYHFFDIQWMKQTSDGLNWLIRSFHEGDSRTLQLLGRIEGTEWGLD